MDKTKNELQKTQQEPACTDANDSKNKPNMDALVLPDVKDIETLHSNKRSGSILFRVAKGSGRILIDEYSTTKCPAKVARKRNRTLGLSPHRQRLAR